MTSMDNIKYMKNRKVLGVLAHDKTFNQIVVGCAMCDGEFLTLNTFEKHVSICHKVLFKVQPKEVQPKEVNVKIETIELLSSDDEMDPEPVKKQKESINSSKIYANSINKELQPSTSGTSRVVQKQPVLKCTFCSKSFKSLLKVNLHISKCKMVKPESKCKYCGKIFKHTATKRNHIQRLHKAEVPFSCRSCYARFSNMKDLTNHIQRTHANGTIVKCKGCKKCFPSEFELRIHIKEKRCGFKFKTADDSRSSSVTKFECYICNVQTTTNFALSQHFKRFHGFHA